MKTTAEYQALTDAGKQEKLKKESFDKWTTYLYLHNSNQKKYGTLMKTFQTQYSLGNNQYCGSITAAADVLTNHVWDATFKQDMKRKHQQRADAKEKIDKIKEEQSHAQGKSSNFKPKCFCCGGEHLLSDCDRKDKIQKRDWANE